MSISVFNYENYVLDFLEGTLSTKEQTLFLQFLQENPQVQKEIQGLNHAKIRLQPSQTIIFEEQRFLKKKITDPLCLKKEEDLTQFFASKKKLNFSLFFQKFSQLAGIFALIFCLVFWIWQNEFIPENQTTNSAIANITVENLVAISEPEPLIAPMIVAQHQYANQKKKAKNIEKNNLSLKAEKITELSQESKLDNLQLELNSVAKAVVDNTINFETEKKINLEVAPENTFDFSDEKKALKSILGVIRFSVKKAKRTYEKE